MYKELKFENPFDTAYGIINIPENMIFYRGYSTKYPAISERFAYYSEKRIASSYVKSSEYRLSAFTNRRELRVLDIRFMMSILREMFYSNTDDESSLPVILSFGLCSLRHQVKLLNRRYQHEQNEGHKLLQKLVDEIDVSSLYEDQGVRVGETANDAYTMSFLSILFKDFIDGFVSPRLDSPYHIEKGSSIPPELIIFNPLRSGIEIVHKLPSTISETSISMIYMMQMKSYLFRYLSRTSKYPIKTKIHHMVGGNENTEIPIVEKINEQWDNPEIQNEIKKGENGAEKWRHSITLGIIEPPAPTLPVSPWTTEAARTSRRKTRKIARA